MDKKGEGEGTSARGGASVSDEAKYAVNRRDNPGYVERFLERPRFAQPILVNLAQSFDSLGSHYPSDGVPGSAHGFLRFARPRV